MDIKTPYGVFTDIDHIEDYGNGTYVLAYLPDTDNIDPFNVGANGSEEPYMLLGFDAPVEDDPVWRFWVEFGDSEGASETEDAELSQSDIDKIIALYERDKGVIVTDDYVE